MKKKEYQKNVEFLQEKGCNLLGRAWDDKEFSAEIESFTKAGGDMIVNLEVLDKEHLQEYIEDFDINAEVLLWWEGGKKSDGLPFDNVKEHYIDLENWVEWLQGVCDEMPY